MFAGFLEEICQIHFPSIVGISGKTNGFDQNFVVAIGVEKSGVNAAKVDKVQGRATHHEHGLKLVAVGKMCKIQNFSALPVHFKLADPADLAVHDCLVGQRLHAEGDSAAAAEGLLLLLILNG